MELQYPAPKRPPLRLTSLSSPNLSPLQTCSWPPATVLDDNWYLQPPQQQHSFHHGQHHASSISPASVLAGDSSHLEEAMWQSMTLQSPEDGDYSQGPFPERPTEPDCHYYMRTGNCAFGMSCRYNHPPNRKLAVALARDRGEYPERPGQPECQYYLKTGTCKFGLTCKYHHPKERAGSLGRVTMNSVGLPLRLGEKDCAFYMRTGTCKFGSTCKFNHPQPAGYRALVTMSGSSLYASGSPSAPSPQPYHTGLPSWSISRGPFMTGSRFQSPSSFAPVIVPPQSLVSVPGWSTYQVQMGPVASLDGQQQALGANFVYGGVPSVMQSSSLSKDNFPERPGQPECQYYVKTGDCKFGMSCRYHHPKERVSSAANCTLSPLGLPLRTGVAHCAFYMRYGMCKFGQTCKFDHPMGSLTYSPSASSLTDWPVAPSPMALSVAYVPPSPESSMLRPKIVLKESANAVVENREFKENYLNGSASEIVHRRSETASSNHSSHSDSADSRANLGEASINVSL